jgi:pimeloyl-ACP methyl ester carboxylesterase
MAELGLNPEAMLGVLAAFKETSRAELAAIAVPTLVVCGADDQDNGSAEALADILPAGRVEIIPGDHIGAVAQAELSQAIADFLTAP